MERKNFESFCSHMHQEHLMEVRRESNYKEQGKPYNEYVLSNLNFLYEAYERKISEQARETLDGFNISNGLHNL